MIIIQRNNYTSFRDENLCTVLSIAAREGHVKIMKILLEHYADINTKDKLKVAICSIYGGPNQMHAQFEHACGNNRCVFNRIPRCIPLQGRAM